ncbi:MAG: hypothetical protein E7632_08305 [Ruminococcaceae bacterium]|nr:hypothetical protein [Oscillospiraceae bacterium]
MDASSAVKEHPELYLRKPNDGNINMVNMADPRARDFIFKKLARIIDDTKMTVFRIDFNFDPEPVFRAHDGKERDGLTELHYYNGLYAFFEQLLAAYPHIVIDNCASGGRRQDFRMCFYSVPIMCSSDYFCAGPNYDPEGIQGHTWGISRWYPVSGDSVGSCSGYPHVAMDTYRVRSSIRSSVGITAPKWELSDEEGAWYHKMIEDIEVIAPFMQLDHYPLTPYTLSDEEWLAFERCGYEGEKGLIMAFRRKDCETDKMTFALSGLCPEASYRLWDIDDGELGVFTGASLSAGYELCIPEKRQAKVVLFEKLA